jgi:hypothetical protein
MWIAAIAFGVLVGAAAIVGLVFFVLFVTRQLGGSQGGWGRLAESYPAHGGPTGQSVPGQTVKIGAVVYKRCVTVGVADEGLFLSVWRKSALIPWSQVTAVGHATLYWQTVPLLTVGNPPVATLTVPTSLWPSMQQRLAHL